MLIYLPVRIIISQLLLLLLYLPHQLLRLLVLAGHDVAHAEVGQHYGGHVEDGIKVLLNDWFIESCRILELVLLQII